MKGRWHCAQIGAREHYAIPRVLHRAGRLGGFYTDFWAGPMVRGLARALPAAGLRSLAGRWHPELATAPVRADNGRALGWELNLRRQIRAGRRYEAYLETGRAFATRVAADIRRRVGSGDVVFAYDTGALEILMAGRERGARCIVNQIDPGRTEELLVREERERWPGWEPSEEHIPTEYHERRQQEWALADGVVVNSEFSRRALMAQGVPEGKLVVIPLCYEEGGREKGEGRREKGEGSGERRAEDRAWKAESRNEGIEGRGQKTENGKRKSQDQNESLLSAFPISPFPPLRVLFLGQVILRKGIQYLMEAARLLQNEAVRFDVVGPIGISEDAVKSAPPNLTFHGRASRDAAGRWYGQSDVFVLPTISDGFALTQLEAMAHGVPVIATPNCGEAVQPEQSGLIVPIREAAALADAIRRFARDRAFLTHCAAGARERSKDFSMEALGANLRQLE